MFIPRHPVVEDQFCKYGATSTAGGAGNVIAYAGSVVYLDSTATNQDSEVLKMAYDASPFSPFGFLMQKVKTGYHSVHPVGMVMPGDLGSSDALAQPTYDGTGSIDGTQAIPVGVAHLGIWDTVHYTCVQTAEDVVGAAILPGADLFAAADDAKVTNSTVAADGTDVIGERCSSIVVAKVVKGVSAAKAQANITNSTQYPIRIKLLV
jgi:hypothetical protein